MSILSRRIMCKGPEIGTIFGLCLKQQWGQCDWMAGERERDNGKNQDQCEGQSQITIGHCMIE